MNRGDTAEQTARGDTKGKQNDMEVVKKNREGRKITLKQGAKKEGKTSSKLQGWSKGKKKKEKRPGEKTRREI